MYDVIPPRTCAQEPHDLLGYKQPVRRVYFAQTEAPTVVKYWNIFVLEKDGKIIGIEFLTHGAGAQNLVLDTLTRKYGSPTIATAEALGNATGA